MSPRARDALISDITQCIAIEAIHTFRPQVTQMQMAIVSPFQRQTTQTTQMRMTTTTMMTTIQSQGTVSAISSSQDSETKVLGGGGHCIA